MLMSSLRIHSRCLLVALALGLGLPATTAGQDPGDVLSQSKISDTVGGFTGDLDAFDGFGGSVAGVGDVDGNGTPDLLVGAGNDDSQNPQTGAAWLLELQADGSVSGHVKISNAVGGFLGQLSPFDHFGRSVALLGDVDGDGIPDMAVGAARDDDGGFQAGAVWILFMTADGTVRDQTKISGSSAGFGSNLSALDLFGTSVAPLGDIDGDTVPDLAVGAPGDSQAALRGGAVWTLLLNDDGTVKASHKITSGVGGFVDPLGLFAAFGVSVATLGDLSSNGTTELAVGATGAQGFKGAVWILSLDASGLVVGHTKIGEGLGGLAAGLDAGEEFGAGLVGLGDLDGDDVADLAVGQPGNDASGTKNGAVWLLFLTANGTVKSERVIGPGSGGFTGTLDGGDRFGASVGVLSPAALGEALTLVAGAPRDDDGGINHGAVWLLTLQGPPEIIEEPNLPLPFPEGGGDGVAGRPVLILKQVKGPGDELTEEPLTVTPKASGTSVRSTEAKANISDEIDFAQPNDWKTGTSPIQAQSGDANGDGTADVFTANQGDGSFSTLMGNDGSGAGDGAEGFDLPVDYLLPFDGSPRSLAVGDFDGDTDPDVVVAGDQGLSIFLNDGLFTGAYVFASFTPVANVNDVITGHVDGDGLLDVITGSGVIAASAAQQGGFVSVLRGQGDGTLLPVGTFAQGRAVASVLLGDVDHEGGLDVLVSAHAVDDGPGGQPQGRLALYLGDGLGGFVAATDPWSKDGVSLGMAGYAVPHPDGIHPRYGALADMNDDGWLDAVYTSADNIAFAPGTFASEQPPVVITVLLNDKLGGYTVDLIGTAYVGRGATPLLADFFTVPGANGVDGPDCILVWHQDTLAGVSGGGTGEGAQTFLAAFIGDGTGLLEDASPNQYLSGDVPGNPIAVDVDPLSQTDGGAPGIDIIVPNMNANSLSVMIGDGAGKISEVRTVADVDDLDPETLPPGLWEGGPRSVRSVRLFGDDLLDIVVYSRWDDLAGFSDSVASVSIYIGDGQGNFSKSQYLPLPGAGEFGLVDINSDGKADLAATVRDGTGTDALLVYPGTGSGVVSVVPVVLAAPAGHELTGGLEVRDIDGDLDGDVIMTSVGPPAGDGAPGTGHLLIQRSTAGGLVPELYDLGVSWDEIRSVDAADLTGDGLTDVLIGSSDGRLFIARAEPGGSFVPQSTNPTAAAKGGGAVRVADLNGDLYTDIVTSNMVTDGTLDQAFVRVLLGAGDATYSVKPMQGKSSMGPHGALRPAIADMNGDGATDVILSHGAAGSVSIVLNKLSAFTSFDAGKVGSGGIAPVLAGKGYTTPGGKVDLSIHGGLGGALGLLSIGTGELPGEMVGVQKVLLNLLIQLEGAPGVAGAGHWELRGHMPNGLELVGAKLALQAILVDPGATGSPGFGFSLTNGLGLTIVQ
jgi:hypothetical protein